MPAAPFKPPFGLSGAVPPPDAFRQLAISSVILSEETASRSEAVPKSKDPRTADASCAASGNFPRAASIVGRCGSFKPSFSLSGAVPPPYVSWDMVLKGLGFQPRRYASPLPLCHPERSVSVRRTVMRSRGTPCPSISSSAPTGSPLRSRSSAVRWLPRISVGGAVLSVKVTNDSAHCAENASAPVA